MSYTDLTGFDGNAKQDHRVCGARWETAKAWHECGDPEDHAMEHRCSCGALYPS